MKFAPSGRLPVAASPTIMQARIRVAFCTLLCCAMQTVHAADPPPPQHDDLDVTMQIIVDPDAKLPDDVIRKIPLPTRSASAASSATKSAGNANGAKGPARAAAARELDHGASEQAKERAQEAAQQRERAGRTIAEEHRQNPPEHEPPRPPTPPGRT